MTEDDLEEAMTHGTYVDAKFTADDLDAAQKALNVFVSGNPIRLATEQRGMLFKQGFAAACRIKNVEIAELNKHISDIYDAQNV